MGIQNYNIINVSIYKNYLNKHCINKIFLVQILNPNNDGDGGDRNPNPNNQGGNNYVPFAGRGLAVG